MPSDPSTVTVPKIQSPGLTVVKSSDAENVVVGQTITYSFLVTNTGNVTILEPTITDTEFSGTGELSPVECPAEPLAPGAEITCAATYTVTQADVDAGAITNTAEGTGTVPGGDPVPPVPSNEVVVGTDPVPAMTVTKTADVDRVTEVGQVVTYSFLVENVGNVTIADPTINEVSFSGNGELSAIVCPAEEITLAPGDAVTCTATYTVVAADLTDGGMLSNTATVTGSTPGGGTIESPTSTVTITTPAPENPADPPVAPVEPGAQPPAAPNPGDLPVTGGALIAPIAGIALLMVIAGGAVLVLRRRENATKEIA